MSEHKGVLTVLHKNCGGQVLPANGWSYKTALLKQDGSQSCCLCGKQGLKESETFEDYR